MTGRLDGEHFKRVLVPVDFSVCTLETLRYAKALAEKYHAVIDLLHVVQPRHGRLEPENAAPGLIRLIRDGAQQELKRLAEVLWRNDAGATVSVRIREGRPDEVILEQAGVTGTGLIIMGTRPRSWLSGCFRRNTVKRVLRHAPCPVMVLRAGMADLGTRPVPRTAPVAVTQ